MLLYADSSSDSEEWPREIVPLLQEQPGGQACLKVSGEEKAECEPPCSLE